FVWSDRREFSRLELVFPLGRCPGADMSLTFQQLTAAVPGVLHVSGDAHITAAVVEVSSEVQPVGVFVAWPGLRVDGHSFIGDAIRRGAVAVVGQQSLGEMGVPYAQVEDAQAAVGYLAAAYHDFPSRKLVVVGVTGT